MTLCGTISLTCRTVGLIRGTGLKGLGTFTGFGVCTAVAHDPGGPGLRADNVGFRVACRIEKGR
jgi:hypothetical protein